LAYSSLPKWKQLLRRNFVDVVKLADFLELSREQCEQLLLRPHFVLSLPLRLAAKIQKRTLDDPILRQFVPLQREGILNSAFMKDPVGDQLSCKAPKLLHKYAGRVLLVMTSACAMHCRYCFRQNFAYDMSNKLFEEELALIAEDPSIQEVILSGGDPLSLDDQLLDSLLQRIAAIPHVAKVRFHTRFPVGIPERIDASFLSVLGKVPVQIWFVIHVNHPQELDDDVFAALKSIQKLGIPVLNQSVLLKDVNDQEDVLVKLSQKLSDHGIVPYYLHQLDRIQGAVHFEVEEKDGLELISALEAQLPGYAVPKYVKEIQGMPSKASIRD
jgi:EF-P beta-lysylation protein EpmB